MSVKQLYDWDGLSYNFSVGQQIMKKYQINYTRTFPDHRQTVDFRQYEGMKWSPLEQLRVLEPWRSYGKVATSPAWPRCSTCTWSVSAWWCTLRWVCTRASSRTKPKAKSCQGLSMAKHHISTTYRKRRWGFLSDKKGMGKFDNVLNKFENEKGGIRDWAREWSTRHTYIIYRI